MCTKPNLINGYQVGCRTCDECIATRRHGWVARAMMEKATSKHALVLCLTYDNSTQENRDAAAMFQYADVMAFNKRLRAAMREIQPGAQMRFLCAGEQGDRNGRCHWHMVIFSDVDPRLCGAFIAKGGARVMRPADMLSSGKRKKRLDWSLWGHGFVTLQEPDQGGMNYVLSYCLKDQFTHEKSKGTMREAKAENFATGLFRMSKRPAIGEQFLYGKLDALEKQGACLPSLNLKVPGFHGYYQPSGEFRKKLIAGLAAVNRRVRWRTGAPCPQFSTLAASLADNQHDLDILNGKEIDEEPLEILLDRKAREIQRAQARREFRNKCGRSLPCEGCMGQATDAELFAHGIARHSESGVWVYTASDGSDLSESKQVNRSHPLCKARGSTLSRHTFPDTDRTQLKKTA